MLPSTKTLHSQPQIEFDVIPADQFTVQELTDVYNDTRTDYLVPMPMNVAKMKAYVDHYDVDLTQSVVAVNEQGFLGIGMLGVRGDKTWITRLGVTPKGRKKGVGRRVMDTLLENSQRLKAEVVILEVIKDNTPAHTLFKSYGFQIIRELLVIRRPPKLIQTTTEITPYIQTLDHAQTLELLESRTDIPSWVSATESMENAGDLAAIMAHTPDGGQGWVAYQNTPFQLGRVLLQTDDDPTLETATALLQVLHQQYPHQDTLIENLAATDKHWPVFEALDYLVAFVRVEMELDLSEIATPRATSSAPSVAAKVLIPQMVC